MDNNRSGIIKEVIIVVLLAAMILTTGGYLVRNVVVSALTADEQQLGRDSADFNLEKTLQDLLGSFLGKKDSTPANKPAPELPPPPTPQPAASQPPQPAEAKPPGALTGKKVEVTQVRFFESGRDIPAPRDRVYRTSFNNQSRFIVTEVSFKNPNYQITEMPIPVVFQFYTVDGKLMTELKKQAEPKKEWATASFASSLGRAEPGFWQQGQYTVKVYMGEQHIGDYKFSVE